MEKKYKYILNMGLAFDEDRAIKKFSAMAKKGWILEKMTLFRYRLVKSERKNLVYSMDYKELEKKDDEYFLLFENSGWQHMCSYGPFHFFAASPGSVPIYTDKENYLNKYSRCNKTYKNTAAISVSLLILVALIKILLSNKILGTMLENVLFFIGAISAVFAAPSVMVAIAYHRRKKRILNNKSKML
ncbi:DUF2812 domain-containing protein [Clostridium sediminicola]|uniref:DUF2812 domain-containing protein n=1 Tax=Clostridium sediminicola TaxID=3114879 RepID=UPI0031F1C4FB